MELGFKSADVKDPFSIDRPHGLCNLHKNVCTMYIDCNITY